ncbi:hypothetical protein [Hyunsoonleella rubra]|uniref:Uncharacterized protein n=1 Tax=Hyunsoonleella rubra TaxID=1737062 RepID=A0ABW5TDR3_9FLAO
MKFNLSKSLIFLLVLLSNFGCTKPIDFDQADDLLLEPVLESSIIFYEATASDFFAGGMLQNVVQDEVGIDIFGDSFVQDNLVKAEFVFEVKNSMDRAFDLRLDFLDGNGQLLESFTVDTPASPDNSEIITEYVETFEGVPLENLKQSRQLVFTLVMQTGPPLNQNSQGTIALKSKGIFYLMIGG